MAIGLGEGALNINGGQIRGEEVADGRLNDLVEDSALVVGGVAFSATLFEETPDELSNPEVTEVAADGRR